MWRGAVSVEEGDSANRDLPLQARAAQLSLETERQVADCRSRVAGGLVCDVVDVLDKLVGCSSSSSSSSSSERGTGRRRGGTDEGGEGRRAKWNSRYELCVVEVEVQGSRRARVQVSVCSCTSLLGRVRSRCERGKLGEARCSFSGWDPCRAGCLAELRPTRSLR